MYVLLTEWVMKVKPDINLVYTILKIEMTPGFLYDKCLGTL
jgi:hypothetical protein